MKVYKFGGASVKDADGVKNIVHILKQEGVANALIVVSAMGKMTNAMEGVVVSYLQKNVDLTYRMNQIREFHASIISELFPENHKIHIDLELIMGQLAGFFATNRSRNYDFVYDQVVGFGELLSTKIIAAHLEEEAVKNTWMDVRDFIKTDSNYREAKVDWHKTNQKISTLKNEGIYITQGFLACNSKGKTTTLGREGSDFSAAIFAYCLDVFEVTIWKDVDGVMNADPRYFENTTLLHQISYNEAIEMAFYGASVIHPKTIKPLQNKGISLRVRSFLNLTLHGTLISNGAVLAPKVPCFILKREQLFLSIAAKDFSFMVEHNLSEVFKIFHQHKMKVNLIQNSALNFSVCVEDKYSNFESFMEIMSNDFKVTVEKGVQLFTIRHTDTASVRSVEEKGAVLLKQMTEDVVQIVLK